jgi:hypothetical protein
LVEARGRALEGRKRNMKEEREREGGKREREREGERRGVNQKI